MRVRADDPGYVAQAREEADFWSRTTTGLTEGEFEARGPIARYCNERFTGDPGLPWYEAIGRFGDFHTGAILGAGGVQQEGRILATNPSLHLTIVDISPGQLARRQQELGQQFPGRVAVRVDDLNFIELPECAYDVIISSSAVHHVTNLEHLAFQIQRALKPDGYFFLRDYVGESRRQFTPARKLAFELLYNRDLMRQGRVPTTLDWTSTTAGASPFCGVRSAEILGVLRTFLREEDARVSAALWFPMLFVRDPHAPVARSLRWRLSARPGLRKIMRFINSRISSPGLVLSDEFIRDLAVAGDRLMKAGELLPGSAFGVYRKAAATPGG
jgi:SAM-dependent methyltransferase